MRKIIVFTTVLLFLSCFSIFAQAETEVASSNGIDWVQVIFVTGYLLGVFVLLPIVIFTNLKEKLFSKSPENQEEIKVIENLSELDRENRAILILEKIEEQLTPFKSDSGEDMVTITSGRQAKFVKRGLDYINKHLVPTNKDIINRVNEFAAVYDDRTKRVFTGSNWIIACAVGVGILLYTTGGISTFLFIHFLGLLFYILASRTTMYTMEKRMKYFGSKGGMIGSIMSGLFLGNGVKYYVTSSDGFKKRDWETEGQMTIIGLVILLVVAMFLGFFAAALGVINSVLNYSTSYLLPFEKNDNWFESNFALG